MMVIYVNMEMITDMVLHFHYKKVGFYFRNRKLLNYGRRKIPLLEYWQYLSYNWNVKLVGLKVLEVTIGNY